MVKTGKKLSAAIPTSSVGAGKSTSVSVAKPSQHSTGQSKIIKTDTGSKQARVIAMLQSPTGTTIATIMRATGWQQHSVRGFLAGVVRKRLKLKLVSKKIDGQRIYQIPSGDSGKVSTRHVS